MTDSIATVSLHVASAQAILSTWMVGYTLLHVRARSDAVQFGARAVQPVGTRVIYLIASLLGVVLLSLLWFVVAQPYRSMFGSVVQILATAAFLVFVVRRRRAGQGIERHRSPQSTERDEALTMRGARALGDVPEDRGPRQ